MECPFCGSRYEQDAVHCGGCGNLLVRGKDDQTVVHSPYDTLDMSAQTTPNTIPANESRRQSPEEWLRNATKAIQVNPNDIHGYWSRCNVLYNLGRYEEALRDIDTILQLKQNRDSCPEHYWRGLILCALGRYEEALIAADKAYSSSPLGVSVPTLKAHVLYNLGRYEEALNAANRAILLDLFGDESFEARKIKEQALNALRRNKQTLIHKGYGRSASHRKVNSIVICK